MQVIKRNGKIEELNFEKLKRAIEFGTQDSNLTLILEQELIPQLKHNMTTKQIQQSLVRLAVEKTSKEEPFWQFIGAKLFLNDLYKEAALNRSYSKFGYGDFRKLIVEGTKKGLYGKYILKNYTKEEIKELGQYINPERDYLFNYIGVKTLTDRYLVKGFAKEILELPQEMFMLIAMHLSINEVDKISWTKRIYDEISQLNMTMATPTMSNARKPFHQLSSCFIDIPDDDLWSIYNTDSSFAQVSKSGGGMGIYCGKIRARGSDIRGFKNTSGGVIPWVKNYNNTAVACDQLGVRKGAVAVYLDVWHKDIMDFLQLRTNNGDERMKAHDVFPAVCVPDIFMKAVENRDNFYLFCPHEVETKMGYRLEDSWGEEFEKRYLECVNAPELSKEVIPAIDIQKTIMKSAWETGIPFVFFRDTVNRMNPNKHKGMIYSSNLCVEIAQNMSPAEFVQDFIKDENGDDIIVTKIKSGDFVVCNLASINLGKVHTKEDIERVVIVAMRAMDNVIDLNMYPVKQAEITNKKYRAVGLGTSGYHQMLVEMDIPWESEEHLKKADEIYELIGYYSIKASMENAKEKGKYKYFEGSEWETGKYFELRNYNDEKWIELKEQVKQYGMRNGYCQAVAPNGSTSLISNSTAGTDPVYSKFWIEEKKNAVIPQTAPNLNMKNFWLYKEAHTIDQNWSIKACGVRQRHIDQSQSFNLYITPELTAKEFLQMYIDSWKNGIKTIYYIRNKSLEVEECTSCSA